MTDATTPKEKISAIITDTRVSVVVDGRFRQFQIDSEVGQKLVEAVRSGSTMDDIRAIASVDVWAVSRVLGGKVVLDDRDQLRLDGKVIDYGLAGVIQKMAVQGFDIEPLTNFIEKVDKNPNKGVAEDLYAFLSKGGLPITPEGDFLSFKNVAKDYFSFHVGADKTFFTEKDSTDVQERTGKAFYPVGGVVWMNREDCDESRDRTCSRGLHTCSFDYLPQFHGGSGQIIICRINPADVTAVPNDYNQTKLRCCRMEVVGEIPYEDAKEYFQHVVDSRHPSLTPPAPEPEPVPEEPVDWEDQGKNAGYESGKSDKENGYAYDPSVTSFPDDLENYDDPLEVTGERQAFSHGFQIGYAEGWEDAEPEPDDAEDESTVTLAQATDWGRLDGAEDATNDHPDTDPSYTCGAHWYLVEEDYADDAVAAYKTAYLLAYAAKHSELNG